MGRIHVSLSIGRWNAWGGDCSWHVLVRYAWVGRTCCVTKPLSVFGLVFASVLTKSSPLRFVSGSWSFLPIDVAVIGVHSLPWSLFVLNAGG